jgi:hypothetical protein
MQLVNVSLILFLEIVGGIFFFTKKNNEINDEVDMNNKHLLCRFVTDNTGKKIGESISLDEDIMVIKTGKKFIGVPLKHIEDQESTLLVKGLIDYDKAYELGEKWRQKSFSKIEQKNDTKEK